MADFDSCHYKLAWDCGHCEDITRRRWLKVGSNFLIGYCLLLFIVATTFSSPTTGSTNANISASLFGFTGKSMPATSPHATWQLPRHVKNTDNLVMADQWWLQPFSQNLPYRPRTRIGFWRDSSKTTNESFANTHGDEAIRALVQNCARAGYLDDQAEAADSLWVLAQDSHNRDVIREEGGIRALIHILSEGEALACAAVVLAKVLQHNSRNGKVPLEEQYIQAIESQRQGTQKAQARAVIALTMLANNRQNRDVIRDEGGIPALVHLLREGNPEIRALAAAALGNLANNRQNRDAIREEGGIKALIQFLREGPKEIQGEVAIALTKLAHTSQNTDAIREDGGVQILIQILRDGTPEARTGAASALRNLANNKLNRPVIREEGGIQALIQVQREGTQEAQQGAADALSILAHNRQNKDVIIQHYSSEASTRASDLDVESGFLCEWIYQRETLRPGQTVKHLHIPDETQGSSSCWALVASSSDLYLIFRGTDSALDWMTNLDAHLTKVSLSIGELLIHRGFWLSAASELTEIRDAINKAWLSHERDSSQPFQRLVICGHSKGGAEAIVAALQLLVPSDPSLAFNIFNYSVAIVTFGAPQVVSIDSKGLNNVRLFLEQNCILRIWEHFADPIPAVLSKRHARLVQSNFGITTILATAVKRLGNFLGVRRLVMFSTLAERYTAVTNSSLHILWKQAPGPEFDFSVHGIKFYRNCFPLLQ